MDHHIITRRLEIDAGHRVPHHGSKCRNLHGHRYIIEATCRGPLYEQGAQEGMVLDFGFLKEEMVQVIDTRCDHGLILWDQDPLLEFMNTSLYGKQVVTREIAEHGYSLQNDTDIGSGKLYVVPFVPTAENLARHWFNQLTPRVVGRTNNQATLSYVKVWETPNCSAQFPVEPRNFDHSLDLEFSTEAKG